MEFGLNDGSCDTCDTGETEGVTTGELVGIGIGNDGVNVLFDGEEEG